MLLIDTYNVLHVTGVLPPEIAGLEPADLADLPDATSRARRLLDTACELEIEPGLSLQWFAVRLEPPVHP